MVFEDRVAKYPGRWTMVNSDGSSKVVTLIRNDEPTKEGTPINAATLNELSTVAGAINAKEEAVSAASSANSAATSADRSAQAALKDAENAEKFAASAKASADKAATIVSTDKTLTIEGAPADAKATGDALNARYTKEEVDALLQNVNPFPVGSIYQTVSFASPAALFGGTWEKIASDRVLMGASSTHAAGSTVEAGLPNIKGQVSNWFAGGTASVTTDVLYAATISSSLGVMWGRSGNETYYAYGKLAIDASHASPVYGKSSTVQPPAYCVYIWRRIS